MAGKNGSTQQSATMETAKPSQSEVPREAPPPVSEQRLHLACSNEAERILTMQPRRPIAHKVPRGMLDRSLQALIGRQLRAIFADIAKEPVPERFLKLLEALDAEEKRR